MIANNKSLFVPNFTNAQRIKINEVFRHHFLDKPTIRDIYINTDSLEVSLVAKQIASEYNYICGLERVNTSEIAPLVASNNTLIFEPDKYYSYNTQYGREAILSCHENGTIVMPYEELGMDPNKLSSPIVAATNEIADFFTFLARDRSLLATVSRYTPPKRLEIFKNVGIEPGMVTIKSAKKENTFCLGKSGLIYPDYQRKGHIIALNKKNWLEEGYTRDSVFRIDGIEYRPDEGGHIHVPEDAFAIQETMEFPPKVGSTNFDD